MNLRPISFVALVLGSALLAFLLGAMTGTRVTPSPRSALPAVVESGDRRPRAEENERTKSALRQIAADLEAAKAENDRLRADESHLIREDRMGAPLLRHEIQLSVQRNLRLIKTLRDYHLRDHGHEAVSMDQLVGPASRLKRLISVDGEDYSSLSLHQDTLTVTTAGGITVWYRDENAPDASSKVEYPANEARFREMEAAQRSIIMAATQAYRVAHSGKDVRKDLELLPYFATPQQAADYLELIDAMKAAGKY